MLKPWGNFFAGCERRGVDIVSHNPATSVRGSDNGGTTKNAQAIAAHERPRTNKLYDRTTGKP